MHLLHLGSRRRKFRPQSGTESLHLAAPSNLCRARLREAYRKAPLGYLDSLLDSPPACFLRRPQRRPACQAGSIDTPQRWPHLSGATTRPSPGQSVERNQDAPRNTRTPAIHECGRRPAPRNERYVLVLARLAIAARPRTCRQRRASTLANRFEGIRNTGCWRSVRQEADRTPRSSPMFASDDLPYLRERQLPEPTHHDPWARLQVNPRALVLRRLGERVKPRNP
jgi:hypothetical protein